MPELRKDPITNRWVIISAIRGQKPSDFHYEVADQADPENCPFCPGNESMTPPEIYAVRSDASAANSADWSVRVVPNKFPALGIDNDLKKQGEGIYDKMTGYGAHEVVIETPDHNKQMAQLTVDEIEGVLQTYQDRVEDLYRDIRFRYVLIFRNEGRLAGASILHPHSQIIATPITPKRVKEELQTSEGYFRVKERCVFCDVIAQERKEEKRIVYENEHFISFCPYASRFPFEICLLPKEHQLHFHQSRAHKRDLAVAMKVTMEKLQVALSQPQYNYIIHTAPNLFPRRGYWHTIQDDYHWHFEIMPHLTRMAGFEWGSGFYINPTAPEDAARYLREAEVSV